MKNSRPVVIVERRPAIPVVRSVDRQSGMSLVEVMVAITISLILMAGAIQIFVGNKQAYRVQDSLAELQENGRFAIDTLKYAVRMADHWGSVEADAVKVGGGVSVSNDCATGWAVNPAVVSAAGQGYGIFGFEGQASSPLGTCIPNADYAANTDVLVVRYGDGSAVPFSVASDSANANRLYLQSEIQRQSVIVPGSGVTNAANTFYFPFKAEVYFIRPCNVRSGPQCDASADNGEPIPTLTRLSLNGQSMTQQTLISGVENFQLEYGVDTDNDQEVEQWLTANNVASSQWDDVMAVRLSVLVRSNTQDFTYVDVDNGQYDMAGVNDVPIPTGREHYYRKVFMHVVQVRNRSRG